MESAVGAHLANAVHSSSLELCYWRDGTREVDFVLRLGTKLFGIEVKSGKKAHRSGMEAFKKAFHPKRVLLVGSGGLPWEEFLRIPPEDLF